MCFGIAVICVVPLLTAPTWVGITAGSILAAGGGVLKAAVRLLMELPHEFGSTRWAGLAHPVEVLRGAFLTVITWIVYVLWRATSAASGVFSRFAVAGAAVLVVTSTVTEML